MIGQFEIGPDRWKLGFERAVRAAFSFLEEELGFQVTEAGPVCVIFESPDVLFRVWHGRGSYELGANIALRSEQANQPVTFYSLPTMAAAAGHPKDPRLLSLQANDPDVLGRCVIRLANLIKDFSLDALRGDKRAFARLAEASKAWSDAYMRDMELSRVREKLQGAWNTKDYNRVVELLEPVVEHLTPAERGKLDYARRHRPPVAK